MAVRTDQRGFRSRGPRRPLGSVGAAIIFATLFLQPSADAAAWKRFTNERTGASVEYPSDLVAGGPIVDMTDGSTGSATLRPTGVRMSSEEGVEIAVYGLESTQARDPYRYLCDTGCEGATYTLSRPTLGVVSGRRADQVFYRRCIRPEAGGLHCFDLEYPVERSRAFDRVVERMSRSLR